MNATRYLKRECTDQTKIKAFLQEAQIGCLGLSDNGQPYVIPLNFVWHQEAVYFHGADSGRKVDIMNVNPSACFTIYEHYGTLTSPIPAHTDSAYMSAVIFGRLEQVENMAEARDVMQAMLDKYVPGFYDSPLAKSHVEKYRSSLGSKTAIFKLPCSDMTVKLNEPVQSKMFRHG